MQARMFDRMRARVIQDRPMKRYNKHGLRLSVHVLAYKPETRQYVRTGRTRTIAVENEREAGALWKAIERRIGEFEMAGK